MLARRRNIFISFQLLAIVLVFLVGYAPSRQWKITGYVVDLEGKPIQGAKAITRSMANFNQADSIFSGLGGELLFDKSILWNRSLFVNAQGYTELNISEMVFSRKHRGNYKFTLYPEIPMPQDLTGYGQLIGSVVDEKGYPIPGTNVMVNGTHLGAACAIDGTYIISGIPSGKYNISAFTVGYGRTRYDHVTILPHSEVNIDFVLYSLAINVTRISWPGPPPFDKYSTSNEWKLSGDQIRTKPATKVDDLLKACPGLSR